MDNHIIANPLEPGADELERFALEECVKRQRLEHRVSVLVVSDKHCDLSIKLARLGAQVTVGDHDAVRSDIAGRSLAAGFRDEIAFLPLDLAQLPAALPGEPFDMIIVRRGLYALRYPEARRVIRELLLKLRIGGKLYVSLLGLHSELGDGYTGEDMPIEQRFAPLSTAMVEKYGISDPICLYTERNLFLLFLEAGASVLRTLTSTYGNVKGIAVRV